MLGWFKKKFTKKEDDTALTAADLKIPVAPRTFGTEAMHDETAAPEAELESSVSLPLPSVESEPAPEELPVKDTEEAVSETADNQENEVAVTAEAESAEQELPEILITEEPVLPPASNAAGPEDRPEAAEAVIESVEEETTDVLGKDLIEQQGDDTAARESIEEEEKGQTQPESPKIIRPHVEDDTSAKIPVAPRAATETPSVSKPVAKKKPLMARLAERLSRTRESFTYQLDSLFLGKKEIDAKLLDDLEELLITADLGVNIAQDILDHARRKVKRKELSDPRSLKQVLKEKLRSYIVDNQTDASLVMPNEGPFVIMVVGVNGVGKTTTIGKIAHKFHQSGQSVLLVAADTFRAAAISQLKIWGERNNIPVITKKEGSDPSAVVYDGIAHAKAKGYDVVLVDTAGRLHTQANLMEELKKIKRVMSKQLDGAPHEVMLVIDATTGQNGISQAKLFHAAVNLTGITLTKLDGTAKGGIIAHICKELKTPIRFIGVGEQLEDLRDFDPDEFIEALFQSSTDRTE